MSNPTPRTMKEILVKKSPLSDGSWVLVTGHKTGTGTISGDTRTGTFAFCCVLSLSGDRNCANNKVILESHDLKECERAFDEMLYKDKPLHEREHPGWEFHPEFKKDVIPHLEDYSWHNDAMPSFCDDATGVMVWVDHLNPDDREYYHKQDVEAHEDVMYYVEQATGKAGEWEHDNNPLLRTDDLTKVKELFNQHRSGVGLPSLFSGDKS